MTKIPEKKSPVMNVWHTIVCVHSQCKYILKIDDWLVGLIVKLE